MRKNILALLVSLVVSVSLGFAHITSLAQTGVNQQAQSKVEQEATRLYSTFSSISIAEGRELFGGSTPELKSALWRVHLRSYMAKHSDLTEKQREVILSAITLITPQLFEIPQDSPDWQAKVDQPLQRLTRNFLEVFPREVARELLTVLGKPQQEGNPVLIKKTSLASKPISRNVQSLDRCTCSRRSDWCEGDSECIVDGCEPTWFCGTLYLYQCYGRCYIVIDPG